MKRPRQLKVLLTGILLVACAAVATPQSQSPDQSAFAALIKSYFTSYVRHDFESLVKHWSLQSPDLPAGIEQAQRIQSGEVVSEVAISQIKVNESKAILQASVDLTLIDPQTNASRRERRVRNFALIKESVEWKIWRDADSSVDLSSFLEKGSEWKVSADSIEQFAVALINASEPERERLLAENPKMITSELRNALSRKVGPLQRPGSYDRALAVLSLVRRISEQLEDEAGIAAAERQTGDVLREWGRWPDAAKRYQTAADMYEAIQNRSLRATTLISLGQVYFAQKNYKLAIDTYQKSLTVFEALSNDRAIADTLEELASVYYEQESYDLALEIFSRCLKLRETYAGKAEIAATHNSIGNVYFQQKEFDSAIKSYQKALSLFEEINNAENNAIKDPDAVVSTLSNIASAQFSQGAYETALDFYLRALRLQDTLRDKRIAATIRVGVANVHSALGNYSSALEYLKPALTVFESLQEKQKIASVLSDIGEAQSNLLNYNDAIQSYQRSAQIFEELKSLGDSSMKHYAIGNIRFFMSEYDLAVDSYQKAFTQFESIKHIPGVASMLASIAGTRYAQHQFDTALEFYEKSLSKYESMNDKARAAGIIERIANVRYSKGEYATCLELVARAVDLATSSANPEALWRARYTQGLAFRATDKPDQAKESFQLAIATIESIKAKLVHGEPDAQRFHQNKNAAYSAMTELLIAENKIPDALLYAERARMNSLGDIFQRARITTAMTQGEEEQELKLERAAVAVKAQIAHERAKREPNLERYASLDLKLQKAIEDYRSFEASLYKSHPVLKALRCENPLQNLDAANELITDSSTALLEFVVTDTNTYLFVLSRDAKAAAPSRSRTPVLTLNCYVVNSGLSDITQRVKSFRELIARRDDKARQSARELYELLFASARDQLSGKTTWLIAPDSILWQLPFAALKPADDKYLIEEHAIVYTPSVTALLEMMKSRVTRNDGPTSLLAFGNPTIDKRTADQATLMSGVEPKTSMQSETEVRSIERLYPSTKAKVYVGTDATEALFRQEAAQFNVIHLAVPGRLSDTNPLHSYLVLSKSEGNIDDGLVETKELLKLNLACEMMIWSSSESSRNGFGGGEAASSLAWSLLIAGCPSTVVSNWADDSPSTTDLFAEFHRSLQAAQTQRSSVRKAKALQRAMLKVLRSEQYKEPYFWAGYSMIGDFG